MLKSTLFNILDKNYEKIIIYKEKLDHLGETHSDLLYTGRNRLEINTISLVLFADAVNYNKSGPNSMWALLSCVAELPPILRVLSFISDSPARSKACFSVQFNGFYGCIKCLQPGERINNRKVYPVSENVVIRSPDVYNNQVQRAIEQGTNFEGIKGFSYL
ncbi:hypothetical protein BpHYR1_042709, partial [Brachionus plicatilis]